MSSGTSTARVRAHYPDNTVDDVPRPVSPCRKAPARLQVVCLLLLASAVAWRRGTYYTGGADIVVVAKAALTALALAVALTARHRPHSWAHLRAAPVLWLTGYLLVATLGGLMYGSVVASLILVVRLALMAGVMVLLVRSYAWQDVMSAVLSSMLGLGLFAGLTGIGSLADGRLEGGLPPLSPNEVSLLLSVPLIAMLWRFANSTAGPLELALAPVLAALVWATGSRTGFGALVFVAALAVVLVGRIPVPMFIAAMLLLPAAVYVAGWTPLLSSFVDRGGSYDLLTLNSRTYAWSAALHYPDTLGERLVGGGLDLKVIPVSAMYRTQQILDSTWMSAWLQVGVVGIAVLAGFVISTLVRALTLPRFDRPLMVAVIAYVNIVSVLESGMFDTSAAFIVFFTSALCLGSSHRAREGIT